MVIEMFGLPYSGKSSFALYIYKKLKSYEIYSYRSLIYKDLFEHSKINYIEYFYLRLIEKRREQVHSKSFFFKLENLLVNLLILLLPIRNKRLSFVIKKNYRKFIKKKFFLEFLYSIKKKNKKVIRVINWIEQELIGYNLSKIKKNYTLLNSEGVIQRCLSLIMRLNLSDDNIKMFLNVCPKPDILIIFNDKKILEKYIANKNKTEKKIFVKKFNLVLNLIKKKFKKVKIFQYSEKNKDQILKDLRILI